MTIHVSSILIPIDYFPIVGYIIISFLLTGTILQAVGHGSLKGYRRLAVGTAIFLSVLALFYYIG